MSKNTTLLIYIGVKMSIKYIYKDRFKLQKKKTKKNSEKGV